VNLLPILIIGWIVLSFFMRANNPAKRKPTAKPTAPKPPSQSPDNREGREWAEWAETAWNATSPVPFRDLRGAMGGQARTAAAKPRQTAPKPPRHSEGEPLVSPFQREIARRYGEPEGPVAYGSMDYDSPEGTCDEEPLHGHDRARREEASARAAIPGIRLGFQPNEMLSGVLYAEILGRRPARKAVAR